MNVMGIMVDVIILALIHKEAMNASVRMDFLQ